MTEREINEGYLMNIRLLAKEAWKDKILPSIPGGKPGAFREPRDMAPFGFDYNGINVEVHPKPTKMKGVVILDLVGIARNKTTHEILVRSLGRVVCLPIIQKE